MSRVPMTQAVAADYADAMLVARRAKNVLFFFLFLALLLQLGIFVAARYVPNLKIHIDVTTTAGPTTAPTTAPVTVIERRTNLEGITRLWSPAIQYIIAATGFLGIVLSIALALVLLILIMIMLVGRLVGVSNVTSALCWAIVLIVILFPWQTLVSGRSHVMQTSPEQVPDVKIPGVLYTYPELERDYDFSSAGPWQYSTLKWARFVGFPVIALLMLLRIQGRSRRGLRYALGEADLIVAQQE